MAWLTSPSRLPSRHWAMPASSASPQVSTSSSERSSTVPTGTVIAESATKPSSVTPTSIESRSPPRSAEPPGIPCTTMSFGDTQIDPGKPRYP